MIKQVITPTPELALALDLADEARAIALDGFRQARLEKNKSATAFDPTTNIDIAIEKMMHERIQAAFPHHQIRGEELAPINPNAAPCWCLDPIDGTRNYYAGYVGWGILIAFGEEGKMHFGIIDHPTTGERFVADRAAGLWIKEKETKTLKTKTQNGLSDSVLAATTPQMFQPNERQAFERISAQAKITLYGGNCYSYGLLALGQIDCVIEAGLKEYDIAALIPIVETAGGVISDWRGQNPLTSNSGQVVASANQALHALLLAKLNETSA